MSLRDDPAVLGAGEIAAAVMHLIAIANNAESVQDLDRAAQHGRKLLQLIQRQRDYAYNAGFQAGRKA